jgi:4-diphosphocytidyl-2-C-methyl-D-erythritol kinase
LTNSHKAVAFPAPAKLNLMLRVLGRRGDGYHLLQTVFRFVQYGDVVRLRLREDGRIVRVRPIPGVEEGADLALRAARSLRDAAGGRWGVDIDVEKRLPMGGGLGGGSSDAATVLLALNRLTGADLSRKHLMQLGLSLGADVPVFLFGESAVGEGVGEILAPIQLPAAWYLVLVPPQGVSTAEIFSHPDLKRDSKPVKIQGFSAVGGNDLEPLACRLCPVIAEYLQWLGSVGPAQMTGSGSCVFAVFDNEVAALAAYRQKPGHMAGFVTRGLDQHPLQGLAAD